MSNLRNVLSFANWSGATGLVLLDDVAEGVVGAVGAVGSGGAASVLNTCISFFLLGYRMFLAQVHRASGLSSRVGRAAADGRPGPNGFAAGSEYPGRCGASRADFPRWPRSPQALPFLS